MKQLVTLINVNIRKWYYFQELKEISLVAAIIAVIWGIFKYGELGVTFLLTETGLIYVTFLMAAIVLALVLKIYYRIIEIKYHEKDVNIGLFKELNIKS